MTTQTEESRGNCRSRRVEFGAASRLRDDKAFARTLVQACSSGPHEAQGWLFEEASRGFTAPFRSHQPV